MAFTPDRTKHVAQQMRALLEHFVGLLDGDGIKVSGVALDADIDIGDVNLLDIAGEKVNPATEDTLDEVADAVGQEIPLVPATAAFLTITLATNPLEAGTGSVGDGTEVEAYEFTEDVPGYQGANIPVDIGEDAAETAANWAALIGSVADVTATADAGVITVTCSTPGVAGQVTAAAPAGEGNAVSELVPGTDEVPAINLHTTLQEIKTLLSPATGLTIGEATIAETSVAQKLVAESTSVVWLWIGAQPGGANSDPVLVGNQTTQNLVLAVADAEGFKFTVFTDASALYIKGTAADKVEYWLGTVA